MVKLNNSVTYAVDKVNLSMSLIKDCLIIYCQMQFPFFFSWLYQKLLLHVLVDVFRDSIQSFQANCGILPQSIKRSMEVLLARV